MLPGFPDVFCEDEHSPTAFSDAHRKMPASAEHHEVDDKWPANVWGDSYDNSFAPVGDGPPEDRTRRTLWSDHWPRVCLHTCGSVFFRLKLWIVAFFPGLGSSEFDFFLMQYRAKRFNTNRRYNFFLDKIFSQFFQRPAFEWTAQKLRGALGGFGNEGFIIFGKLRRSAGTGLGLQCLEAAFIKVFDNRPNMMFGIMNKLSDGRHFIALVGGKNHLGSSNFDSAGTAAENSLDLLSFTDTEVSGIQTHKKSLSMQNSIELFLRVCLYIAGLCMAQVLNLKKVKLIF